MKGYKIITKENKGYNDFQYKVHETYIHNGNIKLCEQGFHFGSNIPECLQYNSFNYDPENYNVLEVNAIGKIDSKKGDKYVTNLIYIEKLLSEEEIYKLCTGRFQLNYRIIYYKDGKLHREDGSPTVNGPAVEHANGRKEWWINGKIHREDGPAIEFANGHKEWYINRKRHRDDGPAIEYADGHKAWFINGKLHREDRPAVETANGDKVWSIDGKKHREDGPAVEFANGYKEWWINGVKISEDKFEIQYPTQKDNNINKCEYP